MEVASPAIEQGLAAAETAVEAGRGLAGTGFWSAVSTVKTHPELVDRYADRIAAIDERAHREWALITVPLWLGTIAVILGAGVGIVLIGWAYALEGLTAVVVFFAGLVTLLTTTHGLAHLLVGWALGMRFTSWFIGKISQPQPGVKLDYATYLRTSPVRRAWMHAAGAIVTKMIPFLLIGAAVAAELPVWAVWLLVAVGLGQLVTDVFWSTKASDWKKFRREMAFAQRS